MHFRCGNSRTEVGAVANFSAFHNATGVRRVGFVAKSHRRVDSRTGLSASFGESRPRRGCSSFCRRGERVASKCNAQSGGGPMSGECRPVNVDVDSDRPRRHSGEGERAKPVQPTAAVTRESRNGMRAVRVGETSHPGPPKVATSFCRGRSSANRFVVLSSDHEEWVPSTVPASSAAMRRIRQVDQPESRPFDREPPPAAVFPMTDDAAGEVASVPQRRRRRRLVDTDSDVSEASPVQVVRGKGRLVRIAQTQIDPPEPTVPDQESYRTSDTESIESRGGISEMEGEVEVASFPEPPVPAVVVPVERFNRSFEWLAGVDLVAVFSQRPCLMKSVPGFMKGAYRSTMRVALTEIDQGRSDGDASRSSRGWKLFLLLPRILLHKLPRSGLVPKKQLHRKFESFSEGDWASLLAASIDCASRAAQASSRRTRRRDPDNLEARAARAEALTHMGELFATRHALEGAAVAPGTRATLAALQNPERPHPT